MIEIVTMLQLQCIERCLPLSGSCLLLAFCIFQSLFIRQDVSALRAAAFQISIRTIHTPIVLDLKWFLIMLCHRVLPMRHCLQRCQLHRQVIMRSSICLLHPIIHILISMQMDLNRLQRRQTQRNPIIELVLAS